MCRGLNDGTTVHRLTVRDVPVDGFWSISVYDADGYFEPDTRHAYSVNSLTARRGQDGSVTVQFGGCDSQSPNCLSIMPGWNYMVRLYSPRAEILSGGWSSHRRRRRGDAPRARVSPAASSTRDENRCRTVLREASRAVHARGTPTSRA